MFLRFVTNLLRLGVWIGRWLGKEGQGACFEDMGRLQPSKIVKTAYKGLKLAFRIAHERRMESGVGWHYPKIHTENKT